MADIEQKMKIKCLVWDLDNTIWDGVLSETSPIFLKPGINEIMQELDHRGILQSAASRNNYDQAMKKLEESGLARYLLYPQISWDSKVQGIKSIAESLNIGLDAVGVIDDDPFELFEIKTYLPQIRTYDACEYDKLTGYEEFIVESITREASMRREMMLSRKTREAAFDAFEGSREEFLLQCRMQLKVRKAVAADAPRIHELASRTNQLNNLLDRVDMDTINRYISQPGHLLFVSELNDRFGYHGIVGVALLDLQPSTAAVRLFCISCRVEGRGIGHSFLGKVIELLQKEYSDLQTVDCAYRQEKRNRPSMLLLKLLGFERTRKGEEMSQYTLKLPFTFNVPFWLSMSD